jgi:hypothetical protein
MSLHPSGITVEKAVAIAAGLVSIAAALATLMDPEVAGRFWPVPLVLCLIAALVASWVGFVLSSRRPRKDDQRRLDSLLALLNRSAIRDIEERDYAIAWPYSLMKPVRALHDRDVPEAQFRDRRIERLRKELHKAATAFDLAMGGNSWPVDHTLTSEDPMMNVGWSNSDLDFLTGEERRRANERLKAIRQAAWGFVDVHERLVHAARRRGYDLAALARSS